MTLLHQPDSVTIVAVEGDEVIVVVQTRPGAGGPTVELPAGSLELGEDPRAAAERELREECSLAAQTWRALGSFWAVPSYSTERVTVFEARDSGRRRASRMPTRTSPSSVGPIETLPGALSDGTSMAAFALWVATPA